MTGPALATVAEANRIGITLAVVDGRLRFRPRGKMTPDLLLRLTAHRAGVLAILALSEPVASDPEPWPDGRPWWVDGIMVDPEAKVVEPPEASKGYQKHLARIRRFAASKAEPVKDEATQSPLLDATASTRPVGGPNRAVDALLASQKIVKETP